MTLAIEGILGVVFTVATLTDEAVDVGEVVTYNVSSFCIFPLINPLMYLVIHSALVVMILILFDSSWSHPDVTMILWQNALGKLQFFASQWLILCG